MLFFCTQRSLLLCLFRTHTGKDTLSHKHMKETYIRSDSILRWTPISAENFTTNGPSVFLPNSSYSEVSKEVETKQKKLLKPIPPGGDQLRPFCSSVKFMDHLFSLEI